MPPEPDPTSRKRANTYTEPHPVLGDAPLPKRSRRTMTKAKEAGGSSALFDCLEGKRLGHAFPRHRLDRARRVQDVSDVYLLDDGSIRCVVKWEPTSFR